MVEIRWTARFRTGDAIICRSTYTFRKGVQSPRLVACGTLLNLDGVLPWLYILLFICNIVGLFVVALFVTLN